MMVLRRKTLVLSFLVLLLVVVAVVNHNFNREVASDKNLTFVKSSDNESGEVPEPGENIAMDDETDGTVEIEQGLEASAESLASTSFYIQSRLDRDKNRSFYIETLNGIVADDKIDKQVREMAQTEMIALIKRSETERIIENLIKAKGFKDALVIMGDEYVNVIVSSEKLTQPQVAQIKDIVSREAKVGLDKIKIMEKQ
ncbi:MAG: Stage III sporulation protein AH [Firmicutes bacterium]|nr:Stage III sporulation protein AH [Bacillota bacterium]MDI6705395.1 SpoIIIAH-like family protein [Bacillota bacterium]